MYRRTFLTMAGCATVSLCTDGTGAGSVFAAQTPARSGPSFVDTPALRIAYVDSGNAQGFPVILLHGFPDDIHAWDAVVPPLTAAGYRTIVPYLRGYGPTQFRDPKAPRMAEQAAIGQDVIDLSRRVEAG
jgi:pimeloyl-ACP methyl ester carboxylesterase